MASRAYPKRPSLTQRGLLVLESLLCMKFPAPPDVSHDADLLEPDGVRTLRERQIDAMTSAACVSCHQLMDPLGFAFSHFDAVGRYQSTELGLPIDASGAFGSGGDCHQFLNHAELSALLAQHPPVQACFVRQLQRFFQQPAQIAGDACTTRDAIDAFAQSGFDVYHAVRALVTAPMMFVRQSE